MTRTLQNSALLTDLYQLTMLHGYQRQGMDATAVFEFFVRRLPGARNFLVAAGLEQALQFLENLAFDDTELSWLADTGRFDAAFIDGLATLRFTGDVDAMPEGTVFFANEPVLRVAAPMPQAQLVESRLINLLQYPTLVASKAARCRLAAPDALLVDFGMRRTHGAEAALAAARATFIGGFDGTATVLAGQRFGLPLFGTMAHSFVQAHSSERDAFRDFAHAQPDNVVLLIDTYDTLAGAREVVSLAGELAREGIRVRAVRLDSGDLVTLAREVRAILDAGGCNDIGIFVSGNMDEYRLAELVGEGAPATGFGVGTHLDVSSDAPFLDCVYKLQEYAGRPRRKRSTGKATWPGRKQVYRRFDDAGRISTDVVTTLDDEDTPGEALLVPVMRGGVRTGDPPTLAALKARCRASLDTLPDDLRALTPCEPFLPTISPRLRALAEETDALTRVRE